jgi:hypothetical protein
VTALAFLPAVLNLVHRGDETAEEVAEPVLRRAA